MKGWDVRTGFKKLADMVYPRVCPVCGRELAVDERHICTECLADMPLTYFWQWKDNPAEKILWARARFERVVSLFFYSRDNGYSRLLHKVKYGGDKALGHYLGETLGSLLSRSGFRADAVVPVPLHWFRLWKRGYNQAAVISEGISDAMGGLPVLSGALKRIRYSKSQTGKTMGAKWDNVSGAFALGKKSVCRRLEGLHVLLVDDVLTSGATAEACYNALCRIPGIRITYVTIAVTAVC